jgi:hypothetical protein
MLGHPAVEGRTSDYSGGPRGTGRGLLVNLGLALAAVAVTLGALEIALRVLDVRTASYHAIAGFTVHDPVLGWKLAPSRETLFRGRTLRGAGLAERGGAARPSLSLRSRARPPAPRARSRSSRPPLGDPRWQGLRSPSSARASRVDRHE